MPESVESWWSRRQWTKGESVPYPIGTYRPDWERYPVLIRQYHPDLNHGINLTQVPPAADVYLLWECDSGHRFVATPEEQRQRPGGSRRRSTWCPDCAALAVPRKRPMASARYGVPMDDADDADGAGDVEPAVARPVYRCGHPRDPDRVESDPDDDRCYLCRRLDSSPITREQLVAMASPSRRPDVSLETGVSRRYLWQCPVGHGSFEASIERVLGGRRCRICRHAAAAADAVAVGEAFTSPWAPKPASAAEGSLRHRLSEAFDLDLSCNAVRVPRPFFEHIEVWPDIVMPELKVAFEYDTTGRDGLEHVGRREEIDKRKDRLLRAAGWEVVRIRCGKLLPIGPHDVVASGVSGKLIERLIEELRLIRGDLIVNSYLR
ncbi:MAG: hypothetical protein JWQ43_1125 [Glaciihabitans sp.]|nr:hypothetical protein [Glaciihabitans sp.]